MSVFRPTSIGRSSSGTGNVSRNSGSTFSEGAISDADRALARVLNELEHLCACDNADQLIAALLQQFNAVTNLSAWSDPKQLH